MKSIKEITDTWKVKKNMNKVTAIVIEGKCYSVAHLTVATLQEYIRDVNVVSDVGAVNAKYGVKKVK